jgi:hypothetical protein
MFYHCPKPYKGKIKDFFFTEKRIGQKIILQKEQNFAPSGHTGLPDLLST